MCSCHSILECCIMFSGVKLSMGSFVSLDIAVCNFSKLCLICIMGNDVLFQETSFYPGISNLE